MINVTTATKNKYKNYDPRSLTIALDGTDFYYGTRIELEDITINEILEANESLSFYGCNSSYAVFSIYNVDTNYVGKPVRITVQAGDTEQIVLFTGIVKAQNTKDYTTGKVTFKCYDYLYTLGNTDVAEWYKSQTFPITIKDFRDNLFSYIGLTCETVDLVNDAITIDRQYIPQNLSAIDVIKNICQLNAVYGKCSRQGIFQFITLPVIASQTYEEVPYCNSINYERYSVKSIEKVIVRQNEDSVGGWYGAEGNTYVLQGNIFTLNLPDYDLTTIATNIYSQVHGRAYVPFELKTALFPWIETGDIITANVFDPSTETSTPMNFYVMSRKMSGNLLCFDSYSARGLEYQSVFISSLSTKIDQLKEEVEQIKQQQESNVIKSYQTKNESQIVLDNTFTKILDFIPFNHYAVNSTDLVFEGSVKFTVETVEVATANDYTITPAALEVKYRIGNSDLEYLPKIIYDDGVYTLALNYQIFGLMKDRLADLEVMARAVTGTITIAADDAQGYVFGQNLAECMLEAISVYQLPLKTTYVVGDELDLSGLLIEGTYSNGSKKYVQTQCTYDPENGSVLGEVGTVTVNVSCDTGEKIVSTSFEITVTVTDFLRYVDYEETLYTYIIKGINTATIEEDDIHTLTIPNEFNGKTVVIKAED